MEAGHRRFDPRESVLSTQERRILLDWVNSLDVDSCMLASGPADLRYGMVLCDLACHLTAKGPIQGVRRGYVALDGNRQDGVHNLGLFLREFQTFLPERLRIRAEDLYEDEDTLFEVLKFWAEYKDPGFVAGLRLETRPRKADSPQFEATGRLISALRPVLKAKSAAETPPPAQSRPNIDEIPPKTVNLTPTKAISRPPLAQHRPQQSLPSEMPLQPPKQAGPETSPVSESTKEHLFAWLQSLSLVRRTVKMEDLPGLCTSGVLICDLVNRLEGRMEAIKGVERNPRHRTNIQANFNKALAYLRGFDKMNSRYLWAVADLMAGTEDVVWGVIEDIRGLFKLSTGALDVQRSRSASRDRSISITVSTRVEAAIGFPKALRRPKRPESAQITQSESTPKHSSSALVKSAADYVPGPISKDMEALVKDWLVALKLGPFLGFEGKHYLSDPLKNGVLLCELVSILEKWRIPNIAKSPESVQAVRENVEKALCLLRDRNSSLPLSLLRQGERIAQGSTKVLWSLLWALRSAYPGLAREATEAPEPKSDLPYSATAMKRLEMSVVNWIYSLGVSGRATCPQDLHDILGELRSGVLLCDLVAKVLPCTLPGVTRGPKSEAVAIANIRKALEPLRKSSRMSQQFVWKEKEIAAGETGAIMGLLEDLHRYSDGLSARKRGPDYHRDGPYLGRQYAGKGYSSALQSLTPRGDVSKAMELARKQASIPLPASTSNLPFESPLTRFRLNRQDQCTLANPQGLQSPGFPSRTDRSSSRERKATDLTEERFFLWMDSIGIPVPKGVRLGEAEGFRNGVLLCQIVEATRKEQIKGFTAHPKTTAAALNNVRKLLEGLRTLPGFPTRLFFTEELVLQGDLGVIQDILKEMYRCFQPSIQASIRLKDRAMRRANSDYSFRHNHSIS